MGCGNSESQISNQVEPKRNKSFNSGSKDLSTSNLNQKNSAGKDSFWDLDLNQYSFNIKTMTENPVPYQKWKGNP